MRGGHIDSDESWYKYGRTFREGLVSAGQRDEAAFCERIIRYAIGDAWHGGLRPAACLIGEVYRVWS
jgi:hypothetical protein